MREIVFLTGSESRYGFALCGIRQEIAGRDEAEARLRQLIVEKDVGLLVIDERLAAAIPRECLEAIEEGWHGLLVTLPAPNAEAGEEDRWQALLRRALGYHVRLEP